MAANPIPMPDPSKRSSPFFSDKEEELKVFFDDYEHHATKAALDDDNKKKEVVRYIGRAQRELWEGLPEFSAAAKTWKDFKEAIEKLYPASDESHKYTIMDLEALAQRTKDRAIRSVKEFGQYHRDFQRILVWLLNNKRTSDLEASRIFWKAFSPSLKEQIRAHLKHVIPDLNPLDPYKLADMAKAAIWVLTDLERDMDPEEASDVRARDVDRRGTKEKERDEDDRRAKRYLLDAPRKEMKKEEYPDSYKDLLSRFDNQQAELIRQRQEQATHQRTLENQNRSLLAALQEFSSNSRAPVQVPRQLYNPNQTQEEHNRAFGYGGQRPNRPPACLFCDDPSHRIMECPSADQYIRDGKCKRDGRGYLQMSNGDAIPAPKGRNLRTRVDEVLSKNVGMWEVSGMDESAKSSNHATYGSFIIEASPAMYQFPGSSLPETYYPDELPSQSPSYDAESSLLRELEVFIARQKETQPHPMATRGKGNRDARDPVIDRGPAQKEVRSTGQPRANPAPVPTPTVQPSMPSQPTPPRAPVHAFPAPADPKYRLRSNAEDPNLVNDLHRRVLDQEVGGITVAHLMAASPAFRSSIQTQTRTQRVEVTHVGMAGVVDEPAELQVSHEAVPLAEIDLILNNALTESAIIDCGSQINIIREDCWRSLMNVVVYAGSSIMMEGADTSISRTHGKLKDLPITIGNTTFYIQAQVVPKAPCRVLLGKPFFALTEARVHTDRMGHTTLYLTNPNPPFEQIIVAARHRVRPKEDTAEVSFYERRGKIEEVNDAGEVIGMAPQVMSNLAMLNRYDARQYFY